MNCPNDFQNYKNPEIYKLNSINSELSDVTNEIENSLVRDI